jgi:hypothetical protein
MRHDQQVLLTVLSVGSGWRLRPPAALYDDAPQLICGRYTETTVITAARRD